LRGRDRSVASSLAFGYGGAVVGTRDATSAFGSQIRAGLLLLPR